MDKLQQNFLMSFPVLAKDNSVCVDLLHGYFREQFVISKQADPKEWWQVFDRTTGVEVPAGRWSFDAASGSVTIKVTVKWHKYTVNFLVVRIWGDFNVQSHHKQLGRQGASDVCGADVSRDAGSHTGVPG